MQKIAYDLENMIVVLVKNLVSHPESVKVNTIINQGQNTIIFGVQVDKDDLGKVIGKQGRNANAMRVLINAAATKEGVRALLDIGNMGVLSNKAQ